MDDSVGNKNIIFCIDNYFYRYVVISFPYLLFIKYFKK